jgi:hypothetical protein
MLRRLRMMFRPTPGWVKQVRVQGQPAVAVVLADPQEVADLQRGGGYQGRDGWIDVAARVEPASAAPFEAAMKCRLSQALFGMLAAGMKVNVRYDPQNKNRVLLVDDVNTLLRYRVQE